jgi:exodeoxyribonuclease-5
MNDYDLMNELNKLDSESNKNDSDSKLPDVKPKDFQITTNKSKPAPRTITIPDFFVRGQREALELMISWLKVPNEYIFILKGPAGTGKTTLLDTFLKNARIGNIVLTAPTHKAVRIASQTTGIKGETIHKLLGFRPNYNLEDFDLANIPFDPLGRSTFELYKLIIVDEASMINLAMSRYMANLASKHKVKILYVGDPFQLPPTKENYSPVFHIKTDYNYTLTEVVRQDKDNSISDLLVEIRKSIAKKDWNYLYHIYNNPNSIKNGKGFMLVRDADVFQKFITKAFTNKALEQNIDFCKYLAYTKLDVLSSNSFIRNSIFPEVNSPLHINDLITGHNTIVNEFNEPKITNSEDYIIDDIMPYRNKYEIEGFGVRFRSTWDGSMTPYLFIVDHTNTKNLLRTIKLFNDAISEVYKHPANRRANSWKAYYELKNENLLLIDIDKSEYSNNYYSKDVDYGFALTVHKSQGSTFNHVFVNLRNIIYGNGSVPSSKIEFANRLFYVAASRAKESLVIYL